MPDTTTVRLLNETNFDGYVVEDYSGYFGKTCDVTKAVAMCLERVRTGGDELAQWVKCYRVYTMGEYAENPGERGIEEYNWERGYRELAG